MYHRLLREPKGKVTTPRQSRNGEAIDLASCSMKVQRCHQSS